MLSLLKKLKNLKRNQIILLAVAILVVLIGFRFILADSGADPKAGVLTRVKLVEASEYQQAEATVRAIGEVESLEQVELKAQVSAQVSAVHVVLGEEVGSGELLVELNHSDIDAQLAQAAASISRMQASVDQRVAGATDEEIAQAAANVTSAEASLEQTKANAEASITNAELAVASAEANLTNSGATSTQSVEDAYTNGLNTARSAVYTATSALSTLTDYQYAYFYCTDDQMCLNLASAKGVAVESLLGQSNAGKWNNFSLAELSGGVKGWADDLAAQTNPDEAEIESLLYEVSGALEDMRYALEVLADGMSSYLALAASSTDQAAVSSAQSSVDGAISSVTAARQAITNAELGLTTSTDTNELAYEQALENLATTKTTAEAMVQIAEAVLAQAEAAYALATADPRDVDLAGLEAAVSESAASYSYIAANRDKYLIKSSFVGVVASVPVKVGELVSPGQIVASVVNDEGLQIKAYINEQDRKLISEGNSVTIEGGYEGVVTNIAPSIDSVSKKIEVIVVITSDEPNITIGEYLEVEINMDELGGEGEEFYLPFDAVKVTTDAAYVYLVGEENRIESAPVELGRVIGDTIQVLSGLDPQWEIIASVRGVSVGEVVEPIKLYE